MESWKHSWRVGFLPQLTSNDLKVLRDALVEDSTKLLQGATTTPPPLTCVSMCPVEAACAMGFCGWQRGLTTVAEVDEFFAAACFKADQLLDEPAGCRHFLNAWDTWTRQELRNNMIAELDFNLNTMAEAVA